MLTFILAITVLAQSTSSPGVALGGKLYRAVFSTGVGTLKPADVDALPESMRARLRTFLERRARFKSAYSHKATTFEAAAVDARKRELERAIVSLIDAAGIEAAAADYVRGAKIYVEWEGFHEGPVEESAFAEQFLAKNPSAPFAPVLHLFIAQRQRAAFETYENEKDAAGMQSAAAKYRDYLARARTASDPIIGWIADDLDRLPYVYIKTGAHPGRQ
jgi:hypothetical protein